MLFYPARDENPKRDKGVFVEECEHAVDEFPNFVFIFALVQAVDDDEEWMTSQRSNGATIGS
jgi:Na+-transporting NADH:ubiquinone oxidoreductase subunit NqrF